MNNTTPSFNDLMKRNEQLEIDILTLRDQMARNEEIVNDIDYYFRGLMDALKKTAR